MILSGSPLDFLGAAPDAMLPKALYAPAPAPSVQRPPNPDVEGMKRATAPKLPAYVGPPINCAVEGNRVPTPLPWWMPPGTVRANLGWFYAFWNVRQLGDLRSPVSQFIPENQVSQQAYDDIFAAWRAASSSKFRLYVDRGSSLGNPPTVPLSWNQPGVKIARTLSLRAFMKTYPQFVLAYRDVTAPQPTQSEMDSDNGTRKFIARGGYLIHTPSVDGREALKHVNLYACAQWVRGCVTSSWPAGVPTCLNQIKIETDNFDWGFFVGRVAGGYNAAISRLPKGTWDHIEDGIRQLTDPLDRFVTAMCDNYNQPVGQAVQGAASAYGGPYVTAAVVAGNTILDRGCRVATSPGVTSGYVPNSSGGGKQPAAAFPSSSASGMSVRVGSAPAYPAGAITWFDASVPGYLLAVPAPAGSATPYVVLAGAQMATPAGVGVVSRWTWERATRPWFKRTSTKISGGVIATAVAAVAAVVVHARA